jgi:hypothetical protein
MAAPISDFIATILTAIFLTLEVKKLKPENILQSESKESEKCFE